MKTVQRIQSVRPFNFTHKPNHAVLLLHGLGGGPSEMVYLRKKLIADGYKVEVPLLPGHCTNFRELKHVRWEEYADAACVAFEKLKKEYEFVSVSGLCLGAVLSLLVGIRYTSQVNSICPISTTLNFDGWGLPFYTRLIWLGRLTPLYYLYNLPECDPYGIKDEKLRRHIKAKMSDTSTTHYSKIPFHSIWEMRKLNMYVKKNLHKITSRICAIHPLEDDVSSIKSVEDIQKGVNSSLFESLILHNSYHLATIDGERDLVARTVSDFFSRRSAFTKAYG